MREPIQLDELMSRSIDNDKVRMLPCNTGQTSLLLDMEHIHSIERTDRLSQSAAGSEDTAFFNHPEFVGWIGDDIPVYSLAVRLGLERERPAVPHTVASSRIIVHKPSSIPAETNGDQHQAWGLLVDRVSQAIEISYGEIASIPRGVVRPSENFYRGVIRSEAGYALVLETERLHPEHETPNELASLPNWWNATDPDNRESDERRATQPAQDRGKAVRGSGRILIFSVAKRLEQARSLSLGLSLTQVPEILGARQLLRVPGSYDHVLGLVNWRNRPVPIVDLGYRLGLTDTVHPTPGTDARLLIARHPGSGDAHEAGFSAMVNGDGAVLVGFFVSPNLRMLVLPAQHRPCTQTLRVNEGMLRGAVELEAETLVIPDVGALLELD